MGRILDLLSLLFSLSAFAAVPGNAPVITIALPGQNTSALSIPLSSLSGTGVNGVFSLYAGLSTTSSDYYPLYKNGVAYTTGTTTKAYCMDITNMVGSAGGAYYQLVSSQASITPGAASLTSGVWQCGAAGNNCSITSLSSLTPASTVGTYVFGDGVHATSAGFQSLTNSTYEIHMECFEQ